MKLKLTEEQEESKKKNIERHGEPISESSWFEVYFMHYSFGVIGIEPDGYSHM